MYVPAVHLRRYTSVKGGGGLGGLWHGATSRNADVGSTAASHKQLAVGHNYQSCCGKGFNHVLPNSIDQDLES